MLFAYLKNTSVDWNFITEDDGYSEQFHKGNGTEWTRGKMLGGTSNINFMVYTRGNYHDYNNWAKLTGDETWNWENVLPYFIKSERLVDPILQQSDASVYHGTEGYLGTIRYYTEEGRKYLDAFQQVGQETVIDVNGNTPVGYTESMFTFADGVRQSTAWAFLTPIKKRPNLCVLKNTLVSKILFDDQNNAIGVEAILENDEVVTFKAKKEVIVSGGAINTPQILMLSGIGPKEHLDSHGIDVISELPVGQALQDHVMVLTVRAMGNSTTKPLNPTKFPVPNVMGYASLDKNQGYPDYQTFNFIQTGPTGMLQFCTYFSFDDEICNALYNGTVGRAVLLNTVYLLYPESRGKILLRSKDPKDKPIIYTGYYSVDEDLDKHVKYIQDYLKVNNSDFFRSVDSKLIIPEKCGCGNFSDTPKFWRCYALCMMLSGYHYAASCPMGHVVDSRLNVFGVNGLRIVDASVMPKIIGANTNAPTIMIAERAADFIKEDHDLCSE